MLDGATSRARRSPFDETGTKRSIELPEGPAVRISIVSPETRFKLRIQEEDLDRAPPLGGSRLAIPINSYVSDGARRTLRLGPNEWLLLAPESESDRVGREVGEALRGVFHSLVDISHRHAALAIAGPEAANVLNAGCPLDLGVRAFPTGTATRTLLGKAEIILMRTGDGPEFRVEFGRSFASYVRAFLAEAARSAG
jgi:sarcosine oxidase subunit gamma